MVTRTVEAADAGRSICVALCDSNDLVAQGLAAVLEREPDLEIVWVAGRMADAITQATSTQPHVVLMDFDLPDGTGSEAARNVMEASPQSAVVMLTSHNSDDVLTAAVQAGCAGFITKDRPVSEIVTAVRRAAAGEALISPDLRAGLLLPVQAEELGFAGELTAREHEILGLLAAAADNHQMAQAMSISVNTVRNHVANLLHKLGAHSRLEAVMIATREGLVDPGGETSA